MSKSNDPVERFHAGVWRIAQLELAGEPVPPAWDAACDALEAECKAREDARKAPQQAALVTAGVAQREAVG